MNKRRLHHVWRRFRAVKPWYFLIATLVFGVISVVALRANNEHMITLRKAVYAADEKGGDVQKALSELQAYVVTHMNTNLSAGPNAVHPPIQLKYTYDRLVQAQSASTSAANQQIYNDAQKYCEQQNPNDFSGRNRVPCISQYVQTHSAQQIKSIPDALYKFDFVSPVWSPDIAGWSLVLTVLFAVLTVLSFVLRWWFKHELK